MNVGQKEKQRDKSVVRPLNMPETAPDVSSADEQANGLREESLRRVFSIIGAIMVYLVIAVIILQVYHPDVAALKILAHKILAEGDAASPKPLEALLFRCAVITMVPAMFGFYVLFPRIQIVKKLTSAGWFTFLSALLLVFIICLVYFDFAAANPFAAEEGHWANTSRDITGKTNFEFYFSGFLLGDYLWAYLFIIVPVLGVVFFTGLKNHHWENKAAYKLIMPAVLYAFAIAAVMAIVLMNMFYFPYTNQNKIDFDAVYFSMTQVYGGLPMLVGHFTNTYGLYPEFLNPVFKIIGLNIFKFSLVMSLLAGGSFLMNLYFLKQYVSNKIILILGFAAVLFFPYFQFKLSGPFDSVFSYYPIRYIIPSTLLVLAHLYFKRPSLKRYFFICIVMSFAILWNPEMGLVSYIAWFVANIYFDFYNSSGVVNKKKILLHIVSGIGSVAVVFLFYECIIYLFYGRAPDLGLLFSTILVFGKLGFGLLPMSLVHPWNLMALILMTGFIYPAIQLYKKEVTTKAAIILLVSMVGLGYFVYFEGRSHNYNFSISSGFCFILLTLFGDELWGIVKKHNVLLLNMLFIVFLSFIAFSFFELVYNIPEIKDLVFQENDKDTQATQQSDIAANKAFFIEKSKEHQKLFLFTSKREDGIFFDGSKRESAFIPGLGDLFLQADLSRIENNLRDSSYDVFIEPVASNYPILAHSFAVMAASYEFVANHTTLSLLKKRKTKIPADTFFNHPDYLLIHRKYTDDTAGLNLRAADASGIKPLGLNHEFSVEVLFYSKQQIYNGAILAGNTIDSTGFVIGNIFNSDNYFFSVSGNGCEVSMPYNEWYYFVMNVFPDRIEIYRNGQSLLRCYIGKPIVYTDKKLYIGNFVNQHYYVGAISEVAITNKTLDSMQIKETWTGIKNVVF